MKINGNYLVIVLIALFAYAIYSMTKSDEQNTSKSVELCESSKSYLFDIENYQSLNKDRLVLTLNVPGNIAMSYEELSEEAKCYLLKVNNERKPSALAVNIYRAKAESYKTVKGNKFIGKIEYAPNGNWGDFNTNAPFKFNFSSFKRELYDK